jgi:hypothetical protein
MAANSVILNNQVRSGNVRNVTASTVFSDYQSLETLVSFYSSLPGTSKISIGTTYTGLDIPAFVFGSGSKQIVFHGGIHARYLWTKELHVIKLFTRF